MNEKEHVSLDRVLGMIHAREGSVIVPLPITAQGPDAHYHLSTHIKWSGTHLNVVLISDTGEHPKHYVSDFRLTREMGTKEPFWKIVHREVDKRFTIEGTDKSLAEDTLKILIAVSRKLSRHYEYPSTLSIQSSRPSLIRFFEKMNFTPEDTGQKELFDAYLSEYRARPREDFLHVDPKVGSRFLLVRESSRKDSVLVDKLHPQYDPTLYGVQKRLVHVAQPPTSKPFVREPYVIRVGLSYEL